MKAIIAIDSSQCSQAALQAVLVHKWGEDDQVRILTVLDLFETLPSFSFDKEAAMDRARELVECAARRIKQRSPSTEVSAEVLEGHPQTVLKDQCESWKADVIVLGAHGQRSVKHLLLGSVSSSLLLHSPCSVLIVKQTNLSTNSRYRNVLLALDNSIHSRTAFNRVLSTDWPDDLQFHILTVAEDPEDLVIFDFRDVRVNEMLRERYELHRTECQKLVDGFARELAEKVGQDRVSAEVVVGHAREQILNKAQMIPAGLIVMGSHGHGFIDSLVLGSVSQAVALQAECSVEVVRTPSAKSKSADKEKETLEVI